MRGRAAPLLFYAGFRVGRAAANAGGPGAALSPGRTRADDLLSLKIEQPCAAALAFLLPSASTA